MPNRHLYQRLASEESGELPVDISRHEKAIVWFESILSGLGTGSAAIAGTYWMITSGVGSAGAGMGVSVSGATAVALISVTAVLSLVFAAPIVYWVGSEYFAAAHHAVDEIRDKSQAKVRLETEIDQLIEKIQIINAELGNREVAIRSDAHFQPKPVSLKPAFKSWYSGFLAGFGNLLGFVWGIASVTMNQVPNAEIKSAWLGWGLLMGSLGLALVFSAAYAYFRHQNVKRDVQLENLRGEVAELEGDLERNKGQLLARLEQQRDARSLATVRLSSEVHALQRQVSVLTAVAKDTIRYSGAQRLVRASSDGFFAKRSSQETVMPARAGIQCVR